MRLTPVTCAVLLASLLHGCAVQGGAPPDGDPAGGKADDPGADGAPVALDDLVVTLARVRCEKILSCCPDGDAHDGSPPYTEANCVDRMREAFSLALASHELSVREGRMAYDAEAAGECVAILRDLTCEENRIVRRLGLAEVGCAPLFHGLIPEGAECGAAAECQSGLFCDFDCAAAETCGATCKAGAPGEGEECHVGPRSRFDGSLALGCGAGLHCAFENCSDDNPFCDAICRPELADGAPCIENGDCASGYCAWHVGDQSWQCAPRDAAAASGTCL